MNKRRAEVEAIVREVVSRTLGEQPSIEAVPRAANSRPILDEAAVLNTRRGSVLELDRRTLITPLARQAALERGIQFQYSGDLESRTYRASQAVASSERARIVAIGADHGGFDLKSLLIEALSAEYTVLDCGTHSKASVDYPDIAYAVARLVADGRAWRGIIIDGAGIGSCMTANKVPGVRAAMCYDQASAHNSREHNNANVLTLGAGLIGPSLAQQIARTWLSTDFAGGRHAKRTQKIARIEQRFLKGDKP